MLPIKICVKKAEKIKLNTLDEEELTVQATIVSKSGGVTTSTDKAQQGESISR